MELAKIWVNKVGYINMHSNVSKCFQTYFEDPYTENATIMIDWVDSDTLNTFS